jgi:transcriptional regulator with XRE-family HTH domain
VSLIEAEPRVSSVVRQLVAERQRRGMSQRSLAALLHTAQQYVSNLECGAVSPTLRTLERWAAALGQVVAVVDSPTEMPPFQRLEPLPVVDPALAASAFSLGRDHV